MKRRKPPRPAAPPLYREWGVKNIQLHRPWLARGKFMSPNSGAVGTLLSSTVKGTNAQRKGRTVLESPASSTLLSSFDDQEEDSAFLGQGLTSWYQSDSRISFQVFSGSLLTEKRKNVKLTMKHETRRQEQNQVCFVLTRKLTFFLFFLVSTSKV